jgi:hypothetical protein
MIDTDTEGVQFVPGRPLQEGEAQPKRRGRPKGSKNKLPGERRPGRPRKSLAEPIAEALTMLNLVPIAIQRDMPPATNEAEQKAYEAFGIKGQGDALDEIEIKRLSVALDYQAQQSPRFRRVIEGFISASSGGQLVGIVIAIGARRAARHQLFGIPRVMDAKISQMLQGGAVDLAAMMMPEPDETEPVEPIVPVSSELDGDQQ